MHMPFAVIVVGVLTIIAVECRWYQNGLVFYDLSTKQIILPPTVSVQRGRGMRLTNIPIFSKLGQPCTCKGLVCGCCAGLEVREYSFNQKMCANVTYVPEREEALLDVFLNENNGAKYGISARNPSPLCVPIMMPIPMAACIQMTQVGLKGDNLHMCMDFVMRLHTTDAMELHFNCLSMGRDGIQYLDKNGNPVLPQSKDAVETATEDGEDEEEYYYDVEEIESSKENEITAYEEDDTNLVGEESGDGQSDLNENNQNDGGETEYYEDTDGLEDNEDVDEVTKLANGQSSTTELSIEENYITDNLIRVYGSV